MKAAVENTVPKASPGITLFVVSVVQFVIPFLMSSINVALPVIGREFNATAVQLGLVHTVQVLALVILLLPMGRFADIHGRKRIFTTGIIILGLSTLALAMVQSIQVFLILRFIQGIGAAMIFSTSLAILTSVFPPGRQGKAMGIAVSSVYAGMAIGPSIAGVIITQAGWRWIFIMIFFMKILVLTLTLTRLKGEWSSAEGEPFDWIGSLVFIGSLLVLIYGAVHLTDMPPAKWIALAGLIGMVGFLRLEWKADYPLLDLHLLMENLLFTFSNLATFINYAAAFSFVFFFSLYLQFAKGLSPQAAGLVLVIQPAVQALLAPVAGRLSDTYPPSRIATIGMGLCTLALAISVVIDAGTPFSLIVIVLVLLGLSIGLFSTSNMTAIMGCVTSRHAGTAASMVATMRTGGMLFSTTVIAVILSVYMGEQPIADHTIGAFIKSMRAALILFSILSLAGTLFSMAKGRLSIKMTVGRHSREAQVKK